MEVIKSCQPALMQQITCHIYQYQADPTLQLHVQYQPGSDTFTCSFTSMSTTTLEIKGGQEEGNGAKEEAQEMLMSLGLLVFFFLLISLFCY